MPEQSERPRTRQSEREPTNGGKGNGEGAAGAALDLASDLDAIAAGVRESFEVGRRVLSYQQYLELYAKDPARQGRDASRYLRDMFLHYGTTTVEAPWGKRTRYRLFDLPWAEPTVQREHLVGQEEVQGEIFRIFENFGREGRPNKLILLHGPNGSSKSTIAACMMRALEHYSALDEGALYRFHWVFPSAKTIKTAIGFGGESGAARGDKSFAHLEEELIDAKLNCEIRDHPLFLLPVTARTKVIGRALAAAGVTEPPPEWLMRGRLSHKSQQIYEALLNSYRGDLKEVLRHVSVERWFISRRYRTGAVTIGPQMSVDAGERQITADRSLAALPASLQAITMFEAFGELIDAAGGLLEFSDLLKRPLDAYKYLQLSVETGEVALQHQNVQLNAVMIGSANEVHLAALREHPEWASFRGRLELVRTGYLRSWVEEKTIYDAQIAPQVRRHVAPHATLVAALFAVLTRMRKPAAERFGPNLASIVASLSAVEKADLYALGTIPERLDADQAKILRASIREVWEESKIYPIYEGRVGASPRELKTALLDAAQDPRFACLSPVAVLDEIEELSSRTGEYDWLQQEVLAGGYHDTRAFREHCKTRLLDMWEDELRVASGLVEERSWLDLFERYVRHVSVWTKGEKVKNAVTGQYEDPDPTLMQHVEKILGVKGDPADFRRGIISGIAAWSIDHPGEQVKNQVVFPQHVRRLKETTFAERQKAIADLCKQLVTFIEGDGRGLDGTQKKNAKASLERLEGMGYCRNCARDAASSLLRWRLT
ncbi:MAG: serine protein kinase PrkA [Deltaproteobacteria bacterium]|nr:serine protein kinase PrkA [Deltaproteobacteria bacterium]